MKYSSEVDNNVLTLTLAGDLIGEESGMELIELASQHIEQGVLACIINISDLRYINSSGIGVLITILTKFRNKGGEVCLVRPSENVKKLLIITKLNAIFNIADSEDEALSLLSNS
jgi:anti-sigma B factor antagonist